MERRLPFIVVPLFIFIMVVVFLVIHWNHKRIYREVSIEYPLVTSQFNFRGVITSIDHPISATHRSDPLSAFITINDSLRVHLITGFEISEQLKLKEALNVGDSIVKDGDTYLVKIYKISERDTLIYRFELSDDLGYPQKKEVN